MFLHVVKSPLKNYIQEHKESHDFLTIFGLLLILLEPIKPSETFRSVNFVLIALNIAFKTL